MKSFLKIFCKSAPEAGQTPAASEHRAPSQMEEQLAAVALAIKMYQEEMFIQESTVITINRTSRVYSPWSSKIHGMRQMPNRK